MACAMDKEFQPYLDVLGNAVTKEDALFAFHEGIIAKRKVGVLYRGVCKVR